jgi:hypothetical protein
MRKLFYSILFVMMLHSFVHAQKNAGLKIILLNQNIFLLPQKTKHPVNFFSLNKLPLPTEKKTKPQSFLSYLSAIKIKETAGKKNTSFFTAFSFGEFLETAFNNVDASLLNTYDDEVPELFKDAPFMLQLKYVISL